MPTSSDENKNVVKQWYSKIKPESVVDLGPGVGTYSDLLRPLDEHPSHWSAVEAWTPYITQFKLNQKYHNVVVADIRYVDFTKVHSRPDLVIAGDILEHLTREDAVEVIGDLQDWTQHLIVSLPIVHYPQGAYQGNWFEEHKHHWTDGEMRQVLGDNVVASKTGRQLGYYLWSADGC